MTLWYCYFYFTASICARDRYENEWSRIYAPVADASSSLLKWLELHFLPCNSLNCPMYLCTLSKTICTKVFDEMQMITKSQKTLNVYFHCMTTLSVTCQQCWRSVFTKNPGQCRTIARSHLLNNTPVMHSDWKIIWLFSSLAGVCWHCDALKMYSAISVKISCCWAPRYIDFHVHNVGWIPTV